MKGRADFSLPQIPHSSSSSSSHNNTFPGLLSPHRPLLVKMDDDTKPRRSSETIGNNENNVPAIPKEEFDDDSKVPFMTARTFFMTILVSMGGICFG
jgi:hypothetical protein